jgi:hypothetical protein
LDQLPHVAANLGEELANLVEVVRVASIGKMAG